MTALVDANSHRTTSLFNGRGDLLSSQDALAAFTSWQYDGVGNATLRTDARNRPTTYTLDLRHEVAQMIVTSRRTAGA